jgi:hypothetical protein
MSTLPSHLQFTTSIVNLRDHHRRDLIRLVHDWFQNDAERFKEFEYAWLVHKRIMGEQRLISASLCHADFASILKSRRFNLGQFINRFEPERLIQCCAVLGIYELSVMTNTGLEKLDERISAFSKCYSLDEICRDSYGILLWSFQVDHFLKWWKIRAEDRNQCRKILLQKKRGWEKEICKHLPDADKTFPVFLEQVRERMIFKTVTDVNWEGGDLIWWCVKHYLCYHQTSLKWTKTS